MVGGDTAAWVRSDDGSNIAARDVNKGRELLDIWFDEANTFVRSRMKEEGYFRGLSVSDIKDDILSNIGWVCVYTHPHVGQDVVLDVRH